jgi:alpha-amylase/alpha-mannosidase (GH57 family)
MTPRYVCIHGHFYQPPREDPWLGEIERQASAHPYHDWNERILAECYRPNAAARILDDAGERRVNNYARISFNFGPTLLGWLAERAHDTYRAILDADRDSHRALGGHGSALAQVYNHMIMPLANRRDKRCQVRWGIRDFEHRFGRTPEGMWLPETAVDLETLEILAEAGCRFTILAPHQARRVRSHGEDAWREVPNGSIDTTLPYEQRLPSGRRLAIFFYHGPTAQAVAFEGLLNDGKHLADRLLALLPEEPGGPRLAHIATDGESYGHHHRFGEMALAFATSDLESREGVRLTNYASFLADHPPAHEVEIVENSSWSCTHGVERWRSDCGCGAVRKKGWDQAWRAPLRDAFDWLRDRLAPAYERRAGKLLRDPWEAREAYVDLLLDRSAAARDAFLERHASRPLSEAERDEVGKLLELQRFAMLMYTSCGWFFEELSRVEPLQVLRYAGRAVELARDVLGDHVEREFLDRLRPARSNRRGRATARTLYLRHVTHRLPIDGGET